MRDSVPPPTEKKTVMPFFFCKRKGQTNGPGVRQGEFSVLWVIKVSS